MMEKDNRSIHVTCKYRTKDKGKVSRTSKESGGVAYSSSPTIYYFRET